MKKTNLFFSCLFQLMLVNVATAQMEKANKLFELNKFPEAIKAYIAAVNKDSKNAEATCKVGECYYLMNQLDEALPWYKSGTILEGVTPMYIMQYGKLLMGKGDYAGANDQFELYSKTNKEEGEHWMTATQFAITGQELPSIYKISNLDINTNSTDFVSSIFGSKLIFSSSRSDIKRNMDQKGGSVKPNQLYYTNIGNDNTLGEVNFLKSDLKNSYNQGPVSYSADGKWVVFTKNNFVDGTRIQLNNGLELGLYIAPVKDNGDWGDAKSFPSNGDYSNGYGSLNQDGSVLYFASDRPGGFGGYDIYSSKRTEDSWTAPVNLGQAVNTVGNEITPFFDGTNLFFASDYHSGFGGMDIFRSEKKGTAFEKIFHLGTGVNSSRDDYGFVFDQKKNRGFLTSNRVGGKGAEDIYMVTKQTEAIVVTVVDEFERFPIAGAKIDFSKCGEKSFTTNEKGQYTLNALGAFDCETSVSKEGYMTQVKKIAYLPGSGAAINILLRKDGAVANGKVLSGKTPLIDVVVKATNQSTGKTYETLTNENGEYTIGLDKNQSYILRFSKAGYKELSSNIETSNIKANEKLPNMNLVSTYNTGNVSVDNNPATTTQTQPNPTSTSTQTQTVVDPSFSIQIATTTLDKTDLKKFENLNELGTVYATKVGQVNKIRIGPYLSKRNADLILESVREKGYKDAFVIDESKKVVVNNNVPAQDPQASNTSNTTTDVVVNHRKKGQVVSNPAEPKSDYKVRLAAFRDAKSFDAKKMAALGEIKEYKSGDFTVMVLSGFDTKDAAAAAKDKAVGLGYKDAYVVTDEGGKLKKVN